MRNMKLKIKKISLGKKHLYQPCYFRLDYYDRRGVIFPIKRDSIETIVFLVKLYAAERVFMANAGVTVNLSFLAPKHVHA